MNDFAIRDGEIVIRFSGYLYSEDDLVSDIETLQRRVHEWPTTAPRVLPVIRDVQALLCRLIEEKVRVEANRNATQGLAQGET